MAIKAYILDLDGVIYLGSDVIVGAVDSVNRLWDHARVLFLTNNSTRSRDNVAARLNASGIRCTKNDVITAGYAAAAHIKKHHGFQTVYPIGEAGLIEELKAQGHTICEDADFVVVGLDRDLHYDKLRIGLQNIVDGAEFIATNTDPVLLTEHGFVPGSGAIVHALETAAGVSPLVIGKPEPPIMDIVLDILKLQADECAIVGDRLETDILAGIRCGMSTVLVLSGVETRESLEHSEIEPDYVIESISELAAIEYVDGGGSRSFGVVMGLII